MKSSVWMTTCQNDTFNRGICSPEKGKGGTQADSLNYSPHVSLILYTSALCCRCWLNPKECNKNKRKNTQNNNKQTNKNTTTNIFHLLCGLLKKRWVSHFTLLNLGQDLHSQQTCITRNGNPHRPPAYKALWPTCSLKYVNILTKWSKRQGSTMSCKTKAQVPGWVVKQTWTMIAAKNERIITWGCIWWRRRRSNWKQMYEIA